MFDAELCLQDSGHIGQNESFQMEGPCICIIFPKSSMSALKARLPGVKGGGGKLGEKSREFGGIRGGKSGKAAFKPHI